MNRMYRFTDIITPGSYEMSAYHVTVYLKYDQIRLHNLFFSILYALSQIYYGVRYDLLNVVKL